MQRPQMFRLNIDAPLAKGLVFAGLGQHAGTTRYHDSSAWGRNGALSGFALSGTTSNWVWDGTLSRWCLDFDGNNDTVTLPVAIPASSLTVSLWIRKVNPFDRDDYFWESGDAFTIRTRQGGSDGITVFGKVGSSYYSAYTASGTVTDWQHICATYDGETLSGYWNGIPFENSNTDISGNLAVSTSVSLSRVAANQALGKMSDCLIYQRVLSSPEIRQLADPSNAMLSGLILPPRRRWWPVAGTTAAFKAFWANQATQVAS